MKFVLKHNPEIDSKRVEVAPNSVELREVAMEGSGEGRAVLYQEEV